MQQAFPVFEGAEGGRVHAPVEYIQIKELTEAVRNYGVSANFTIAQVERLANHTMTPGDWQTSKSCSPQYGNVSLMESLVARLLPDAGKGQCHHGRGSKNVDV